MQAVLTQTEEQYKEVFTDFEDLNSIYKVLKDLRLKSADADVVAPVDKMHFAENGNLILKGDQFPNGSMIIAPDNNMLTQMAKVFFGQIKYLRRLQERSPEMLVSHFNDWIRWQQEAGRRKNFLIRTYKDNVDDASDSFYSGRAFLSDSYKIIDNLPIFQAALDAINMAASEHGIRVAHVKQSLTPGNMYLRFYCPDQQYKTHLLRDYRNPETREKAKGGICTGFILRNSEIGRGKFGIAPRLLTPVCLNGMVIAKEEKGFFHLGGKQDKGMIKWSDATRAANRELIKCEVRDAVSAFLSPKFLGKYIHQIEKAGEVALESPIYAVQNVCGDLGFNEAQTEQTLNWFSNQGSGSRAIDVVHAVTYTAHSLNPQDRYDVEAKMLPVLERMKRYDRKPEEFQQN